MSAKSPLNDKMVLVVDDEPDVVVSVEEMLPMCIVHKAFDYDAALQLLLGYTYDIVILDIMGVNGFELLKLSVKRGFPTVMFTAHALSPESLKKSIRLGAVSFLPKERISDLQSHLEDVVLEKGRGAWRRLFQKQGGFFDRRFGPDWKEKDRFFEEFEKDILGELDPKA